MVEQWLGVVGASPSTAFGLCVGTALVIQWVAWLPSFMARTERFYDLVGSATYLTVVALALAVAPRADARAWLLGAMVGLWAVRLGGFLFWRVRAHGGDGRFDAIKQSALRFAVAWTLQGVWVSVTAGAAVAAIVRSSGVPLGGLDAVGFGVWAVGFATEVVADAQKSAHRRRNGRTFIRTGLWARSRHPNYAGEIVLWVGTALVAVSGLNGVWLVTLVSPVFVYGLLTRVSGVPLLEARADARWGGDADYVAWRDATPVLWPRWTRTA